MAVFRNVFFVLLVLGSGISTAQNVVLRGYAHYVHKGKIISAYGYDDLITYTRVKLATDTIDAVKGDFELNFDVEHPSKVELKVDNLIGNMHVMPQYYYGVTYPPADSLYDLSPNAEYPVELGFIIKNKNDTNEMNSLIVDFNRFWRSFFVQNYQYFQMKKGTDRRLDTFQYRCIERYKNVKEPYFKVWLNYAIADINASTGRNPIWLADKYIVNKPILYNEFEYMNFFNNYFKRYLYEKASSAKGSDIIDVINENGDFAMLNAVMKKDPVLQNDSLRELVLIKNLYELYFVPQFKRDKVLQMIEQAGRLTANSEHKKIVRNILNAVYKLSPGSDAPAFSLLNKSGKPVSLSDYKGKYVYLGFMATWSETCLKELKEIADLKKKYGDKVVFIIISTDEKQEDFKKFFDKNPKYDWVILHFGNDKGVKDRYNVKAVPTYFFLNQEGKLVLSPALSPTAGFERVLLKMFYPKRLQKQNGPIKDN